MVTAFAILAPKAFLKVPELPRAMRVPLHDAHARLGARFVEFAGFEMPVQYSSILEEHAAVRQRAGLFDVSHMSNLWIRGAGAKKLLSETVCTNPEKIKVGRASYTTALREDGTIIDDLIYYKFSEDEFHVVPNAGMNHTLTSWFTAHAGPNVTVEDVSREYCIFALQGPKTREILRRAAPDAVEVKKFGFVERKYGRRKGFVSGTGYTGEDGVEFVVPNEDAVHLFESLLKAGGADLKPVGLGARDTLRLEKGYCLAGHEFAGGRTPLEAGLEWTVHWDHDFEGKAELESQKSKDDFDRLVGLLCEDRGIPRQDFPIMMDHRAVGKVTSGTLSPTLNQGIALGYVPKSESAVGTQLAVDVRGRPLRARVAKLPFL